MAKINQIIPAQSFELARDQIATILKNELVNQANLEADFDEPEVYINRFVNPDQSYLPAVNVTTDRGSYQNQSIRHQWGVYSYQIECYHKSKGTQQKEASQEASAKLEKLMGKVRAILMHPEYYHLDFAEKIVGRRYFNDFSVGNPTDTRDSQSVSLSAMLFNVEITESFTLQTPQVIQEHHTIVLLKDGGGHKWIYQ